MSSISLLILGGGLLVAVGKGFTAFSLVFLGCFGVCSGFLNYLGLKTLT